MENTEFTHTPTRTPQELRAISEGYRTLLDAGEIRQVLQAVRGEPKQDLFAFDDILADVAEQYPGSVLRLIRNQPDLSQYLYSLNIISEVLPNQCMRVLAERPDPENFRLTLLDILPRNPESTLEFFQKQHAIGRYVRNLRPLQDVDPKLLMKHFGEIKPAVLPVLSDSEKAAFAKQMDVAKGMWLDNIRKKVPSKDFNAISTFLVDRPYMEVFFISLAIDQNPSFFITPAGQRYLSGDAFSVELAKGGSKLYFLRNFSGQTRMVNIVDARNAEAWRKVYKELPDIVVPYNTSKSDSPYTERVMSLPLGPNIGEVVSWLEEAKLPFQYGDLLARLMLQAMARTAEVIRHGHLHYGNFVVMFEDLHTKEQSDDPRKWIEEGWQPRVYVIDFDQAQQRVESQTTS